MDNDCIGKLIAQLFTTLPVYFNNGGVDAGGNQFLRKVVGDGSSTDNHGIGYPSGADSKLFEERSGFCRIGGNRRNIPFFKYEFPVRDDYLIVPFDHGNQDVMVECSDIHHFLMNER